MEEIWKPIQGFEGRYEVSCTGLVRSIYGRLGVGRILKPSIGKKGYLSVELCGRTTDGKYTSIRKNIHRLVADAFLPIDPDRPVVDHINCNKQDNRVENLKRCTHDENNKNPITLERKEKGIQRACTTEAFRKKCSDAASSRKKAVRCIETGMIYESQVAAARSTGKSPATIQESCRNKPISPRRNVLHFEYVN